MRRGWMRERGGRRGRIAGLAAVLALGLVLVAGCQKRVVSTRNDWVGSQWGRLEREQLIERQRKEQEQQGTLDRIGDTMFGWTDDIFSGGEEEEPEEYEFGYTGSRTPGQQGEDDERTVQRSSDNAGLKVPN